MTQRNLDACVCNNFIRINIKINVNSIDKLAK